MTLGFTPPELLVVREPVPEAAQDILYMERALGLARRGAGLASPNPMVGAVLVRDDGQDGRVIAEAFYTYDGVKHAEVKGLEQAREAARGATLYTNLEPCCHTGRTGPCAQALVEAGVARVVAGMEDPDPLVSGGGFRMLREALVAVQMGVLEEDCRRLNEHFARHRTAGLPFVTLKAAMTLDGKIAAPGDSTAWITGAEARAFVHRLRHAHDALVTGVGTILADDPLLTDRSEQPRRRPLLRVVLDSALRIPKESRVVASADDDLMVVCGVGADDGRQRALEARRVRVLRAPQSRPDLKWLLRKLAEREIISVLLEAGANMNAAALEADAIDKLVMIYAPKVLGGADAVPSFGGRGQRDMEAARPVRISSLYRLEEDVVVEGYLHDVYGNH